MAPLYTVLWLINGTGGPNHTKVGCCVGQSKSQLSKDMGHLVSPCLLCEEIERVFHAPPKCTVTQFAISVGNGPEAILLKIKSQNERREKKNQKVKARDSTRTLHDVSAGSFRQLILEASFG